MKSLLFLRSGRQLHLHLRASLATGAMALNRRNSALKERELRGTRDLLNAETAFRPGRAVTENMKLNMAGSGDLIGGQQNPPSRLPGGVKLGGCYRNPRGTMLQFG